MQSFSNRFDQSTPMFGVPIAIKPVGSCHRYGQMGQFESLFTRLAGDQVTKSLELATAIFLGKNRELEIGEPRNGFRIWCSGKLTKKIRKNLLTSIRNRYYS